MNDTAQALDIPAIGSPVSFGAFGSSLRKRIE